MRMENTVRMKKAMRMRMEMRMENTVRRKKAMR